MAESKIKHVQCEGLAALKIIKHCHEEGTVEVAQGALLGLVDGNKLEITNCFPFLKNSDENIDEEEYQLTMMRKLHRVNVDHFHVGWYQSCTNGNFISLTLLESLYHYQTSIEESIVIVYDTQKSETGFLALKAYRLTPQAIAMYKGKDFTPEALRKIKIGYEQLFIEIPIKIRNSTLTNILMLELKEMIPEEDGSEFLDLGVANVLQNHLQEIMDKADELHQESSKVNKYHQAVMRQEQEKNNQLNKLAHDNALRIAKGEPAVPEQTILRRFRPLPIPPRLNPMIVSGQINTISQQINEFCSQSLAKLYLTQPLQNAKQSKMNK